MQQVTIELTNEQIEKVKSFYRFVTDAHYIDFSIRKDGKDIKKQADWVKDICRTIYAKTEN